MTRIISLPAILMVAITCCPFLNPSFSRLAVADETSGATGQSMLITQWQSQVMVDGQRGGIAEIHLHVHDDRADSYYELTYPGFRATYSFDDLNPRGIPFREVDPEDPAAGARQWAELKKEIFEAAGKTDVKIQLHTVPRSTIYAVTTSGGIHAINAETGQTRWKTRIGKFDEPTIGIASNNTRIIAVRGSKVYCLNALTGDEVWSRYSHYAPGGGVSISDDYAYVTAINGRLQMFPLAGNGLPEAFFASSGAANFDPAVTANTVSWATERGYFNVARSTIVSLRYRLETNDEFESAGAAVGDKLIANSTSGKVYALDERRGSLVWEFAVGERLDKTPIAISRDAVMLITAGNKLVALDANKGTILDGWPKRVSGVKDFVGASQNILYFIGSEGRLVGLNRASGAVVSSTPIGSSDLAIPNDVTDRLYVTQANGMIKCMREVANLNPVVRGDDFVVGNSAAANKDSAKEPESDGKVNPFEAGDMKAEEPEAGGGDPFGDDPADPFSGGGDDSNSEDPADPFSGGDDDDDEDEGSGDDG